MDFKSILNSFSSNIAVRINTRNIKSCKPGSQFQKSLLETLQPLNPEIADDVEDMQALESMTIHGAFASGNVKKLCPFCCDLEHSCVFMKLCPLDMHLLSCWEDSPSPPKPYFGNLLCILFRANYKVT